MSQYWGNRCLKANKIQIVLEAKGSGKKREVWKYRAGSRQGRCRGVGWEWAWEVWRSWVGVDTGGVEESGGSGQGNVEVWGWG